MLLTVFFNDGSFLCGLLSWGFAGAAVTCVGNYKRGGPPEPVELALLRGGHALAVV